MESEEVTGKPTRRKLKRVVQKKKKADLNVSSSVKYYKKVKAACNVSLNTSKVSQTLKTNNKALAQNLQNVKLDLRLALNEIGRLKTENQELSMKIMRLENQMGAVPQDRLEGLTAVFDNINRCLLEIGNSVNKGQDLCLASLQQQQEQPSLSLAAFQPQSLGEPSSVTNQPEKMEPPSSSPLPVAAGEVEDPVDDEWVGELGAAGGKNNGLDTMTPDMSIIMEQSVLMDAEEPSVFAVPQDAGKKGLKSRKVSSLSLCKLPQRVRLGNSNKENAISPEPGFLGRAAQTKFGSPNVRNARNKKGAEYVDSSAAAPAPRSLRRGTFVLGRTEPGANTCLRRETFVIGGSEENVSSPAESTASSGSFENIADIPMPELVPRSPLKSSDHESEMLEPHSSDDTDDTDQNAQQADPAGTTTAKSQTECRGSPKKVHSHDTRSGSVTTGREKRKSTERRSSGKKSAPASAKQSKAPVAQSKKDTEFFISNPCALNLVHKKVMGTSEGCLGADKPLEHQDPKSTLDNFMAHIKESNKKSKSLASFRDEPSTSQKSTESSATANGLGDETADSQPEDHTVFFDSDMEFTQVLPQSLSLKALTEEQGKETTTQIPQEARGQLTSKQKEKESMEVDEKKVSNKSKRRATSGKAETAETIRDDVGVDKTDCEKKLAVALRVSKPGQMVFAASRKEDDGSRKAIPAKLQSRSRSKSKKQMEELAKSLPQTEPEGIFDFHDRTPRPAAAEGKSSQHSSVFDLSLNDTAPGAGTCSLASLREKLKALNSHAKESTSSLEQGEAASTSKEKSAPAGKGKAAPTLLGDAPVYLVPLKDDSAESEPKPRSRGRSSSRSKDKKRQSRSRSRSGDGEEKPEAIRRSARSRSRTRPKYACDDESVLTSPTSSPKETKVARGRSRSRAKKGEDDDDYQPSTRSRPRARSRHGQTDEHPAEKLTSPTSSKKVARGRSRSRARKGDADDNDVDSMTCSRQTEDQSTEKEDDAVTSPKEKTVVQRSRSRARKEDNNEKSPTRNIYDNADGASPVSSPKKKTIPRGRSRGRLRKGDDDDDDSKVSKNDNSDNNPPTNKVEDNTDAAASVSSPKKTIARGRSRSRARKGDGDQSRTQPVEESSQVGIDDDSDSKSQPRGRSRHRQTDKPTEKGDGDPEAASPVSSPKEKAAALGRSRSRVRKDDQSDNKTSNGSQLRGRSCHRKTDDEPTDSDAVEQDMPLQHRVRSRGRTLGKESKQEEEPSVSLCLTTWDRAQESCSDSAGHQTKSSSGHLHQGISMEEKASPVHSFVSKRRDRGSDKRKVTNENSETEQLVSPSKKKCIEEKSANNSETVEASVVVVANNVTVENTSDKQGSRSVVSKEASSIPAASSTKLKRRSSLPIAKPLAKEEEGRTQESPASAKSKSKSVSKIPAAKSTEKGGKDKYQLDFDAVNQKLAELDTPPPVDSDLSAKNKSRPLVLPVRSGAAPATKSGRSLPGNNTSSEQSSRKSTAGSKKGKSQPGSPRTKPAARLLGSKVPSFSALPSAASPQSRDSCGSGGVFQVLDESAQPDARRAGRRAAAAVSYKEPSLNVKLRRGDPHTTFLNKDDLKHIYKSPKGQKKRDTLESRHALIDLTNVDAE